MTFPETNLSVTIPFTLTLEEEAFPINRYSLSLVGVNKENAPLVMQQLCFVTSEHTHQLVMLLIKLPFVP